MLEIREHTNLSDPRAHKFGVLEIREHTNMRDPRAYKFGVLEIRGIEKMKWTKSSMQKT